jgi:catechol 2,3-dioxygenase-like lactoylglutathione lyase family enzyme
LRNLVGMGERPRVIDHIGVGVRDFEQSLEFYTRALAPLGFERVAFVDADNRSAGFGIRGRDDFWIHEGRPTGRMHVAFDSESREAVDAFHAAALEAGARDNGPPGVRPEHSPTYYAAYVLDPNGNNIEAVFHGTAPSSPGELLPR